MLVKEQSIPRVDGAVKPLVTQQAELASSTYSPFKEYVAGAVAGVAGLTVGHPLDTTKVHMQTQRIVQSRGSWRAFVDVYGHGWSSGLFRGLCFPVVSYGLVNSVLFGVYGQALKLVGDSNDALNQHSSSKYSGIALCGCVGGLTQVFIACPVDVVKVVLQSHFAPAANDVHARAAAAGSRHHLRGPVDCIRELYKAGGLRRCYSGFNIMLLRDVPASTSYFVIFEFTRDLLNRSPPYHQGLDESAVLRRGAGFEVFANLTAGGIAGVVSWAIIFPIDVVKSRLQADYLRQRFPGGWRQCVADIVGESRAAGRTPWKAFYTGMTPCLLRAFPVNAVTFAVNREMLKMLND